MPKTDPVLRARSRVGNAARAGDAERLADARRDLKTATVERAIQKALADAPRPSAEQRARLAALLTGGADR